MKTTNPIVEGLEAVREIIVRMTTTPPEIEAARNAMREEMQQYSKKQLIEMLVNERIRSTVPEPTQKDLILAIFQDERTTVLTYDEISIAILENLDTKLKYAPHNISWWRSQFNTAGEEMPARMTNAERTKLNRRMAMEAVNGSKK